MAAYQAEDVTSIQARVGERIQLESLHEAVVPPNLMLIPFWDTPDMLEIESQVPLDQEGVHAVTATFHARCAGSGDVVLGFRNLRTNEVVRDKRIHIEVARAKS
jgi:hypothetical protein